MTHRILFERGALIQLNGFPRDAFDALVERVLELVEKPWDATVMPPGDDPAIRQTVFGRATACCPFMPTTTPS
ncbi:MAG TPA: hypothetical protein VGD68_13945 [Streptosporangiaceae bacterium]